MRDFQHNQLLRCKAEQTDSGRSGFYCRNEKHFYGCFDTWSQWKTAVVLHDRLSNSTVLSLLPLVSHTKQRQHTHTHMLPMCCTLHTWHFTPWAINKWNNKSLGFTVSESMGWYKKSGACWNMEFFCANSCWWNSCSIYMSVLREKIKDMFKF